MRLLEDRRLGGESRYVLTSAERLMLVPDEIRKCVGFLAYDGAAGRSLCGTVFVGGLPLVEGRHARFALTAAHVLDEVYKRTVNGKLHLRFNKRGGGFVWLETALDDWIRHPTDPIVDCALIPLPMPKEADVLGFTFDENYLTEDSIAKLSIGMGDEVFFTGLFINHAGTNENIPIVRGGTIAAMPSEPVRTDRGLMQAYLIEARSIGGLSGSPAFVQIARAHAWEGSPIQRTVPYFFFMGLVSGHWDVAPFSDAVVADSLKDEVVNMGIAIVTPAQSVMETLEQPRITAMMSKWRQEIESKQMPTPDVAS